jgi:hypothetical protein
MHFKLNKFSKLEIRISKFEFKFSNANLNNGGSIALENVIELGSFVEVIDYLGAKIRNKRQRD